jgi:inosose dehydratase
VIGFQLILKSASRKRSILLNCLNFVVRQDWMVGRNNVTRDQKGKDSKNALSGIMASCWVGAHSGRSSSRANRQVLRSPSLSATEWSSLIRNTQRIAKEATSCGSQVVFHPHAETHIETEEQVGHFLAETDPQSVNLCLDTGHHRYCGGEPVTFFRENKSRIPYLHLKSCNLAIRTRAAQQNLSFSEAVKIGAMAEPAEGDVDFVAFAKALEETNYRGYAIVEQDMYPVDFDRPLPIAVRSRDYLLRLGIG